MLTIACVRAGKKYPIDYVTNLRDGLMRYLPDSFGPYRLICLTDQDDKIEEIENVRFDGLLVNEHERELVSGWWPKLFIFNRDLVGHDPVLYFDLDTVIVDDLSPLIRLCLANDHFLICRNFTKLAGHTSWPCNYGSCLMYLPTGWGMFVYKSFIKNYELNIKKNPRGDQQYIESVMPNAWYFQDYLPKGFLVGRREFTDSKPAGAAVMIFAGQHKPHNTKHEWLRRSWHGQSTEGCSTI